jgi:hypothetical protein
LKYGCFSASVAVNRSAGSMRRKLNHKELSFYPY